MSFAPSTVIPRLQQRIFVNQVEDARLWCTSIRPGSGAGATVAEFEVPELLWDSARADLKNAEVWVWVKARPEYPFAADPDFIGFISSEDAEVTESTDRMSFTAYSITKYLGGSHVGEVEEDDDRSEWDVSYPLIDKKTGTRTRWTPKRVLQDIFDNMSSFYAAHVELGDMKVLNDSSDVNSPEIQFRMSDYAAGIDQVVAVFGDVAYRERFSGSKSKLDFYRIADINSPRASVRVARWDSVLINMANVARISKNESTIESITRVIGYGTPRRCMVSPKSYVANLATQSESTVAKRLTRYWDTTLEALVLANPKACASENLSYTATVKVAATSGATSLSIKVGITLPVGCILVAANGEQMRVTAFTPGATQADPGTATVTRAYNSTTAAALVLEQVLKIRVPGIEFVFRRYRLPDCFANVLRMRENAQKKADLKPYPVQVWSYKSLLKPDATLEKLKTASIDTKPSLLEGSRLNLDEGVFILRKPAVEAISVERTGAASATKTTYQETVVGITFTFEHPEYHLRYDTTTGAPPYSVNLPFAADGQTERIQKDTYVYSQHTNYSYPVTAPNSDTPLYFDSVWFGENGELHVETVKSVIQDNTDGLRNLCQQILREKDRVHRSYNIDIPWFARGYQIGYLLDIYGQADYVPDVYKITSVEWNMPLNGRHSTRLTVDNVKPPHRTKSRGRARRGR